jgi:hypothetical protein
MLDDEANERLRKLENRKKADAAANDARRAFMEQSGLSPADLEGEDALTHVIEAATTSSESVDLVGWAKGEKQCSAPAFSAHGGFRSGWSIRGNWLV